MTTDLRTRAKVREFFLQWLKIDQVPDLSKNPAAISRLRRDDHCRPEDVARPVPGGRRLGRVGGFSPLAALGRNLSQRPARSILRRGPSRRRAVPEDSIRSREPRGSLDASLSHGDVFLHDDDLADSPRRVPHAERLGTSAAAAADGFRAALAGLARRSVHPRARTLQTKPTSCMSCHAMINPLGFGLEHFDPVGLIGRGSRPSDRRDRYL